MPDSVKNRMMTEEDAMEILQRYSASTIIILLQEVSEHTSKHPDGVRIDWNELVKTTCTGISNAREYQMVWRHLAYQNPLLEKIEDEAEPLDDDSDLEFEIDAVPALSPEELAEAKECAKVILSNGSPRVCGSTPRLTEDSLKVDIPNDHALLDAPPDKLAGSPCGGNTLTPVSNQKTPLSAGLSVEVLDGNGPGSSGLPTKKKRHLWTKEEDMELIAAVQKCGEGNWANILKGDFKHNLTASQLSQRWALIRKRHGNPNPDNGNKTSSLARSEERLAAQKAFSLAVDMPMTGSLSIFSGSTQMTGSSTSSAATSQASRACAAQSLNQSQDNGSSSILIKARPTLKKPLITGKLSGRPNPIQAAAFAAGGRIANLSTAASLFKAAQSTKAFHIRSGVGVSPPISSTIASKPSSASNASGPQSTPQPQPALPSSTQPFPASFGTTLSSQRSSQHPGVASAGCAYQASAGSTLEAVQNPKLHGGADGKSSVGSDISRVDGEELSVVDVGGGSGEVALASAAKKDVSKMCPDAQSEKSQVVVGEDDRLQNKAAAGLEQASVDVKDLRDSGSAEDGCFGSQIVGNKVEDHGSESKPVAARPENVLQPEQLDQGWQLVCGPHQEADLDDPRLNPLAEGGPPLGGLGCGRVLVCVAGGDLIRDRGRAYHDRLRECGWKGTAEIFESEGEDHGFYFEKPEEGKAAELMDRLVGFFGAH